MSNLTVLKTGPLSVNTYFIPLTDNLSSSEGGRVLVVDPAACALSNDADAVTSLLKAHRWKTAGVVLTHGHFDHILGIPQLAASFSPLTVAIAKEDRGAIDGDGALNIASLEMMGDDGEIRMALDAVLQCNKNTVIFHGGQVLSDVFYQDTDETERRALSEWQVIATPGHTKGSVCLYNKTAGTLISGDTMFYHGYGRTDLGGSEAHLVSSIKMLYKTIPPSTLVFPGHDRYGFPISTNC